MLGGGAQCEISVRYSPFLNCVVQFSTAVFLATVMIGPTGGDDLPCDIPYHHYCFAPPLGDYSQLFGPKKKLVKIPAVTELWT